MTVSTVFGRNAGSKGFLGEVHAAQPLVDVNKTIQSAHICYGGSESRSKEPAGLGRAARHGDRVGRAVIVAFVPLAEERVGPTQMRRTRSEHARIRRPPGDELGNCCFPYEPVYAKIWA